ASVKGDQGKLIKIADIRGFRAISPLVSTYNQAFKGSTGTTAERTVQAQQAVQDVILSKVNSQADSGTIDDDFARAMAGTFRQLSQVTEELKGEFARELLPVLQESTPKFKELIPAIVNLTHKLVDAL